MEQQARGAKNTGQHASLSHSRAPQVGVCHLHAVDPDRVDTQAGGERQFMVSAFYPCSPEGSIVYARFVDVFEPSVEEALAYLTEGLDAQARQSLIAQLMGRSLTALQDAPANCSAGPYPALIYYPWSGNNRFAAADLCTALAGAGVMLCLLWTVRMMPTLWCFPTGACLRDR